MPTDSRKDCTTGKGDLVGDSQDLPFPMLFGEDVPPEYLGPSRSFDITQKLTELLGRAGPTGHRDKILILASPQDRHVDRVALELARRGAPVCRFHTEEFLQNCRLSINLNNPAEGLGFLELPTCDLALDEVKSIWFRRPDLPLLDSLLNRRKPGSGGAFDFMKREADAVLRGLFGVLDKAFWVSHPDSLKAANNKLAGLKLAESLGLLIPHTLVTNDPQRVRAFFETCHGDMIVKTFYGWSGSIDGSLQTIYTSRVLPEHLDQLELVRHMPCLFQEYVPKDVELRITVIGRRVFATEIHSQNSPRSRDDWRRYDLQHTPYYPHTLPADVEAACLRILEHYGLAFGAFDMIRRPDGAYVFLELNANGQWLWIQELTGLPLVAAMADLLIRGSIE